MYVLFYNNACKLYVLFKNYIAEKSIETSNLCFFCLISLLYTHRSPEMVY
jgi:hypothetical protein